MRRFAILAFFLATNCGDGASPDGVTSAADAGQRGLDSGADSGHQGRQTPDAHLQTVDANAPSEGRDDGGIVGPLPLTVDAGVAADEAVYDQAHAIVTHALHTTYSHETYIDEETGTFDVDCSGFVNFVLEQALPEAFTELAAATLARPVAASYVTFALGLADTPSGRWRRVALPSALVPGDVVMWLEPPAVKSTDTGHVMVVAARPVVARGEVDVEVFDSTTSGHGSTDARTASGASGVGEGTVAITVDASGAATGYRWSTDSYSIRYATTVALGHLQ